MEPVVVAQVTGKLRVIEFDDDQWAIQRGTEKGVWSNKRFCRTKLGLMTALCDLMEISSVNRARKWCHPRKLARLEQVLNAIEPLPMWREAVLNDRTVVSEDGVVSIQLQPLKASPRSSEGS